MLFYFSQPPEVTGLFPPPDLTNLVIEPANLNNGYKILCVVTTHPGNYKSKVRVSKTNVCGVTGGASVRHWGGDRFNSLSKLRHS